MQKIKVKIIGRMVHDVGYRVLLANKAMSLGVDNFNTFNTYLDGVQGVIVVIEANDEAIEEFKGFVVSVKPENSVVDDVSFEEYRNSVPPVERVLQSLQLEQWGKGIPLLLQIADKLDTNTSILKENTSILKDFKEESNDNFSDLKSIGSKHEIDASSRLSSIHEEISKIKERLSNVESAVSAV